ncbi:non-hydrolyzing UDP-N-acetylglucosamine 2-epimerase [uncultured Cohaesibacter sp.]|uniref:non-hydrolyzing UDP-N-acetylglucosamine 2-epimerase n=1 Tax=uncultured Cohaesibacter sp. TaxID=1002546 RepID=UPI00292D8E88|nr:UDP-N-acetylglucosamine 2-epimerase (non-hydrolyzing) [uncultured Cohaesibacter sp.]
MKIVSVVGARPQFVKAAVLREFFLEHGVDEILVHTGQHYDHNMSDVFFEQMNIAAPDYRCVLENRSHGGMTGEILHKIEDILIKEKPDYCLVYGDTNSTLAAALAAAKLLIPVCHVEAGLRSFNKNMPEEINRILTDHVSKLLFCSTPESLKNLKHEGITNGVHHVGDIMYDAVLRFSKTVESQDLVSQVIKRDERPLAVMTVHRQENVQDKQRLSEVLDFCDAFGKDFQIVFPCHPNTRNKIKEFGLSYSNINVVDPVPYQSIQALLNQASLALTDSGGLQKEAYFHQTRCITLRDETEWVETIENGWNRLWTSSGYACEPRSIEDYGDGDTRSKILKLLERTLEQ